MTLPGPDLFPGAGTFPSVLDHFRGTPLTPVLLTVDGNDFGTDDGQVLLVFDKLDGWYSGPGSRTNFTDRPNAHGSFDAPVYRTARVVTVSGWAYSDSRAAVVTAIRRLTGILAEGQAGVVTVDDPDYGTLSITARLTDGPLIGWDSFDHCWTWQFSVTAPDPHKYGIELTASTPLPTPGAGGLVFPLFDVTGLLEFGAPGVRSQIMLSNSGTADTYLLFVVAGAVLGGLTITDVATGRQITYVGDVPFGAVLTINPVTGRADLNGADRTGLLTSNEWWPVTAGGSSTVQFSTQGVSGQSGTLTASIRPAYW